MKRVGSLMGLAVLLLSQSSFVAGPVEAGTGVGSGGNGDRAAYIEKLKAELSVGTRVTNAKATGADQLYAWCAKVTGMLKREQGRAMLQLQREKLDTAEQILKDALVVASESLHTDPDSASPMTKRMIDRGVIYADGIEKAIEQEGAELTRLDRLTEIDFMSGFIDHIIKTERTLDRPYYIPYYYNYNRCHAECPGDFVREFSRRYLEYARAELKFVVKHSVNEDPRRGRVVITPIGRPEAFLKLAELSSGLLADEISQVLESYSYACMVGDLRSLSEILLNYNVFGNRTVFPDCGTVHCHAVEGTARELNRILGNFSCTGPDYPVDSPIELLSGTITLSAGESRYLRLESPMYIQKIRVQAQSYYRDATVEVIVNGDIKGTIHLPAYDPKYFVTIADTTDLIEFRELSGGSVMISSVKATVGF